MSNPSFADLYREVARGKTIGRILMNRALSSFRGDIRGVVLDLASGPGASYWAWLQPHAASVVKVDRTIRYRPSVVADLRRPLPLADGIADAVILSQYLNIAPDPAGLLGEMRRVLKPDGVAIVSINLIAPHNPEPNDYWRFTAEGLQLLFQRAGFGSVQVVALGDRWTAAAYLLFPFWRPWRLVAPPVYWACLRLDALTARYSRLPACPVGYVVRAALDGKP
jgi:SAM-dependent methyltransferase